MESSYFYPARASSDSISQFESKEPQSTWKEFCPALGGKKETQKTANHLFFG